MDTGRKLFSSPKIHLWILLGYAILVPVSYYFGWLNSVTFVSALSIWALVESRLGTYKAAVVAKKQDDDADVAEVLAEVQKITT